MRTLRAVTASTLVVSESLSRTELESAVSRKTPDARPEIAGEREPKHINTSYAERLPTHAPPATLASAPTLN